MTLFWTVYDIYSDKNYNDCTDDPSPGRAGTGDLWCAVSTNARIEWGYCLKPPANQTASNDCGHFWTKDTITGQNCYSALNLANGALNWADAEANCNSIGGHLLSITSPAELVYVRDQTRSLVGMPSLGI